MTGFATIASRIARIASRADTPNVELPPTRRLRAAFAVACLALVLGVAACGPVGGGSATGESAIGGPFHLTDQEGVRVDQRLLDGKWSLVFFGYTFCPDVCPATLTNLAAALDRLGPDAAHVRVVFITVDPQRDTPAQLREYLSSPSFPKGTIGLTGTPDQIATVARAYRVYYQKAGSGPSYSVDHSSIVYLMNPHGQFVAPVGVGASPADVARQIAAAMHAA
jgi:protein SCO1/2